jgi:P-type Ca2+ transporter type 2C
MAILRSLAAGRKKELPLPEIARQCGFSISAEELATVVRGHDARA